MTAADAPPAVAVEGLTKSYGAVRALDGVDLACGRGEIVGVLGPNGAGKTTLIEILEGLRRPDGGRAEVLGVDLADAAGARRLRARIGIAMQRTELPQRLTVEELLAIYGAFYDRPRPADELIERLGLGEKRRARSGTLSGGQLQRLAVGLALVGRPELLFLDEPTSQLDPQSRRAVWELLLEAQSGGCTVLVNTHQMDEAEQLCACVAVLDHGRILAVGTPAELIARHAGSRVLRFVTDADVPPLGDGAAVEVSPLGEGRRAVTVRTAALADTLGLLMAARARGRFAVDGLDLERASLEDVFLTLTGRRIRD